MRRRTLLVGVVLVATGPLAGCGQERPVGPAGPTAAVAPTTDPARPLSAAARVLADLQASVADLGAVQVSGGTPGAGGAGRTKAWSDLESGAFDATISLGRGEGSVRMIRQSDLTWTKAPPSFWIGLGYTAASAREARGKWVVARAEAIKPLIASFDPGSSIRALLALEPQSALAVRRVRTGPRRGQRVLTLAQGSGRQQVYLGAGRRPRLLRVVSTQGAATTALDFRELPVGLRVRLPDPADVIQPR